MQILHGVVCCGMSSLRMLSCGMLWCGMLCVRACARLVCASRGNYHKKLRVWPKAWVFGFISSQLTTSFKNKFLVGFTNQVETNLDTLIHLVFR